MAIHPYVYRQLLIDHLITLSMVFRGRSRLWATDIYVRQIKKALPLIKEIIKPNQ